MQCNVDCCNHAIATPQLDADCLCARAPYFEPNRRAEKPSRRQRTRQMTQNGIHHVTAIAGQARRNVEFYTKTLGMRLIKRTVNFDDPGTYHLYYGDETGQPGTALTFFPWEHVAPGRIGVGQTQET